MKSNSLVKTAKTGYLILSAVFCILGILLIVYPDISLDLLCWVVGVLLIVYGIFKMAGYFSRDLFRLAFTYDLAFGMLDVLLGVVVLSHRFAAVNLLTLLIGIVILADAMFKFQITIDAKRFGIEKWWLILIAAIAAGAFGLLLIINPFRGAQVLMRVLGIALLLEGLLNFIVVFFTVKIVKNQKPDYIEGTYKEM
ncbi:MAG: DUF308 domain-containing protein [Eubacteriales bacterium]|nr:DUF308 domain-containing protein [Eubacteriales bacterium]